MTKNRIDRKVRRYSYSVLRKDRKYWVDLWEVYLKSIYSLD